MARVVLLSPPSMGYRFASAEEMWSYPPVGICYIASALRADGHEVSLLDLTFSPDPEAEAERLASEEPGALFAVGGTTPQIEAAYRLVAAVRRGNAGARVVIGGPHASALPERTLRESGADALVHGEGELTMRSLARLHGGGGWGGLGRERGVAFLRGGRAVVAPRREIVRELDGLPFPSYDLLPIPRYGDFMMGPALPILSSRGCPHDCAFCASAVVHGHAYRARSAENVADELEHWSEGWGVRSFYFADDQFTAQPERVRRLCSEIIRRRLDIEWFCSARADTVSRELLACMGAAGCTMVGYGVESGDPGVLEGIGKRLSLDDVRRAAHWSRELGISAWGFFILGLPGDDEGSVRRTIELALSLPLDQASFAFLVPFPGTRMWEMCERGEGLRLLGDGWPSFVRYETPVAEPSGLPAALLASLHAEACRRFYLRPGYLARRLGIVMRNRARARLLRVNLRMLLGIARSSLSSPGRAAPQPS